MGGRLKQGKFSEMKDQNIVQITSCLLAARKRDISEGLHLLSKRETVTRVVHAAGSVDAA